MDNFVSQFTNTVINNWNYVALSGGQYSKDIKYCELAQNIENFRTLCERFSIPSGANIAICGKNCCNWASIYFSIIVNGYTAVVFPTDFPSSELEKFIQHSECHIAIIDPDIYSQIDCSKLSNIKVIIDLSSLNILFHKDFETSYQNCSFSKDSSIVKKKDVAYHRPASDSCTIMYSSGTSGTPKGVILTIANLSEECRENMLPYHSRECHVNILPFSHIFGLVCELILPLCVGMKLIINNSVSPIHIEGLLALYHPRLVFSTPMYLEFLVNSKIGNIDKIKSLNEKNDFSQFETCRNILINSFGGRVEAIFTGGAAFQKDIETLIVDKLRIPLITAYGMTECGALSFGIVGKYKSHSSGNLVNGKKIRIFPSNSLNTPGEIQTKDKLFVGYYKDPESTRAAFTEDGWFKTGDLGYIDEEENLFITGRCKDMLLTSNGENIYPEEVESSMNASPYIRESILVQRGEKLYAIVVPDREKAEVVNLDVEALEKKIDQAVREASKKLPGFTIISGFELRDEPLERTPKGSLKRYLYSDGINEQ